MLCLQLEKIMNDDVLTDYKPTVSFKGQFNDLNKRQEQSLQQAIATGLVEQMARRQSVYDQKGNVIEKPKKQFYECQQNLQSLRIPTTCLLEMDRKDQPQYILYHEIYSIESQEPTGEDSHYMRGVTVLSDVSWLAKHANRLLLDYSQPLTEHSPSCVANEDLRRDLILAKRLKKELLYVENGQAFVHCAIFYGPKKWKLQLQAVELSQIKHSCRNYFGYFAYMILKGEVDPRFKQFSKFFGSSIESFLDESDLSARVAVFKSQLSKFDVDSAEKLRARWESVNRNYLLDALLLWVRSGTEA